MQDRSCHDALAELPPLSPAHAFSPLGRCKICGGPAKLFDVADFNKFANPHGDCYAYGFSGVVVHYLRCTECGFLYTRFCDDWTSEDFSRFLYNDDYIKVDGEYADIRPRAFAEAMAARLGPHTDARILDYGSGSGAFVRALRERGFHHVEGFDPFSNPTRPTGRFDIITCIEVIEHTTNPAGTLSDIRSFLADTGCVLFSQALQPPEIEQLRGNWWYIAPRNGHVSFYTEDALALLAQQCGLMFCRGDEGLYGLRLGGQSAASAHAIRDLAPPFAAVMLLAPTGSEASENWHGVEPGPSSPYRWTARNRLAWKLPALPAYPCTLRVMVPLINQIEPGFAASCAVAIGPTIRPVSLGLGGSVLSADIALTGPADGRVELMTPEPISPTASGHATDQRKLGIAVPVQRGSQGIVATPA